MKLRNISLITLCTGATLTGKGLQGRLFTSTQRQSEAFNMREAIKKRKDLDFDFATMANSREKEGILIPDADAFSILEEYFNPSATVKSVWLDGVGRTVAQMEHLRKYLRKHGAYDVEVLNFRMTREQSEKRFMATVNAPDRQGRTDAELDVHLSRFDAHMSLQPSIMACCRKFDWRIHNIDAGHTALHVHKDIRQKLHLGKLTDLQRRAADGLISAVSAPKNTARFPATQSTASQYATA